MQLSVREELRNFLQTLMQFTGVITEHFAGLGAGKKLRFFGQRL